MKIDRIYPLTPEEIAAATILLKQWRGALFDRPTTDRIKATNLIDRGYRYLGWPETPAIFTKGIMHAASIIEGEFTDSSNHHNFPINYDNYQGLLRGLEELTLCKKAADISCEYTKEIIELSDKYPGIDRILGQEADLILYIYKWIYAPLEYMMAVLIDRRIDSDLYCLNNSLYQYFIERLNLTHDPEAWDIFYNLTQECPYLIPLTRFCLVIDRPKSIYLDREGLPHADDRPAMKFRDRTKVYFYHGIPIPAKYGKVPRHRWKPKWLLSEDRPDLENILAVVIGCKRFRQALPHIRRNFWQNRYDLIGDSIDIIISWQLYYLEGLYLKDARAEKVCLTEAEVKERIKYLPIELPLELYCLYNFYNGGYQLCPELTFYPLGLAIERLSDFRWLRSPEGGYPFPLFKGERGEIYFITVGNRKTNFARVYCQFPERAAIVYTECVTSLIVTIGQCYRENAYELTIDSASGSKDIAANLSAIEAIFDKFNPDSIDAWRAIQLT